MSRKSDLPHQDDGWIDVTAMYFLDIEEYKLLSVEEEVKLSKRAREGDREAVNLLVKANLRFVIKVAKEYENPVVPLIELIQAGNTGLITAAERFDGSKGWKFISYAVWWIRQAMLQHLAEHSRTVRIPLNRNADLIEVSRVFRELTWALGREPSIHDVASALGLDYEETKELEFLVESGGKAVSLDKPLENSESKGTRLDFLEDNADTPDSLDFEMEDFLPEVKATLTEREYQVIKMYFGLEGVKQMNLEQIGRVIKLTRERVRQIRNEALDKLRKKLSVAKYAS